MATAKERWEAAAHRIQTAIGFYFGLEYPWMDDRLLNALKHLRVGIDTSKADHESLVRLLLYKGVITEEEYEKAAVAGQEREADFQQQVLEQRAGADPGSIRTL